MNPRQRRGVFLMLVSAILAVAVFFGVASAFAAAPLGFLGFATCRCSTGPGRSQFPRAAPRWL